MSPTQDALKKLAVGFESPVPQLVTPPRMAQVNGRMAVTRTGEGAAHPAATCEHELLAGPLTKKAMLPTAPARWPGGTDGFGTTARSSSMS